MSVELLLLKNNTIFWEMRHTAKASITRNHVVRITLSTSASLTRQQRQSDISLCLTLIFSKYISE